MQQTRDYIFLYLNGQPLKVSGEQAFMTVTDFLRQSHHLTGTKVVCAEGDCGACTVLVAAVRPQQSARQICFVPINACIQFMHGLDACHLVTIEGITPKDGTLHPVQQAMVDAQATQCGFCTPGFVMAGAGMLEANGGQPARTPQQAKNYLTGNLCRCTGYQSIIEAMLHIPTAGHQSVAATWHTDDAHQALSDHLSIPVDVRAGEHRFQAPTNLSMAAAILSEPGLRLFAACTDLGVQHNKGQWEQQQAVSINLVPEAHQLTITAEQVSIGARVTLAALEAQLEPVFPEWSQFMHVFASPQIKNNGTLVGNIANGSPIGDNLPFLLAMDARIHIQGNQQQRETDINDFYLGYRKKDLHSGELISHVVIPRPAEPGFIRLYKASQRRDLDISCVAAAFRFSFDEQQRISQAALALGGVAATALRIPEVEALLLGKHLDEVTSQAFTGQLVRTLDQHISPMSDVRGSEAFRRQLVSNLYRRFIAELKLAMEVSDAI